MACTYLYILPILVFIWFPLSFILTFTLAVVFGHVNPLFPYISDTGTFSPESCLFGQLISIGIVMLGVVIYIRYRQVRELYHNHNLPLKVQKLNQASIIVGLIAAFGISIVGNFQETNVISVHLAGAFTGFGLATTYLVIQTVISYKLFPMAGKLWIVYTRVVLSSMCVITFLFCVLFAALSVPQFKGNISAMTKWSPEDGGWELHIISAISEWLTAIVIMCYVLTFSPEFRNIALSEPVVHIEDALLNQSESNPVT